MLLRDYTKPELEYFVEQCNFTDSELEYFNLKAKDYSIIKISMEVNVSPRQVSNLADRVKRKINRIK